MNSGNIISWFDPAGTEIILPAKAGVKSRMMPPVEVTSTQVPFQPGGRAMEFRHGARQVVVPLNLHDTPDNLRDLYRSWAYLLDATRGYGTLRMTRGIDGSYRDLTCRCVSGWDFAEEVEFYSTPELTFAAIDDPYWYSPADPPVQFTAASTTGLTLWFPFSFPFTFGASEVFATQGLPNSGDVAAWPVWTITGPGSDLTVTNNDTDGKLALTGTGFSLAQHQFVVIDTRPRFKTVTRSDGASMFSSLSLDSEMFSIAPGGASVSVAMAGATTASLVSVEYRQRFLAA